VPVPEGVSTPAWVIDPPVAVQLTDLLKEPVPFTVAVQVEDCPVVMEDGAATTLIEVTVGVGEDEDDVTVMLAEPVTLVYPDRAELATHIAVPAPLGVNTPLCVIVPPVAVHVTAFE